MAESFQLLLLIGPVLAVPAPQPVVDALSAVQVTTTAGQASGFQLTFSVSKDSVINRVLLPAGFFDPSIRVILVVVMNGIPTVLMDGVIIRQEVAPSDDPGASTLTVTGEAPPSEPSPDAGSGPVAAAAGARGEAEAP